MSYNVQDRGNFTGGGLDVSLLSLLLGPFGKIDLVALIIMNISMAFLQSWQSKRSKLEGYMQPISWSKLRNKE